MGDGSTSNAVRHLSKKHSIEGKVKLVCRPGLPTIHGFHDFNLIIRWAPPLQVALAVFRFSFSVPSFCPKFLSSRDNHSEYFKGGRTTLVYPLGGGGQTTLVYTRGDRHT